MINLYQIVDMSKQIHILEDNLCILAASQTSIMLYIHNSKRRRKTHTRRGKTESEREKSFLSSEKQHLCLMFIRGLIELGV